MRRMVIGLLVVGLVFGPGAMRTAFAQADDELGAADDTAAHDTLTTHEEPGPGASLGWGMAAVGTNLGYMPAKMLYGLAGGFVGLLALAVTGGNSDVAMGILQPALAGTWVVTPEMLRGEEPIMFIGPSYEPSTTS